MKQKTYLVTGGSAGIGLATTRSLLEQGDRVIITGRSAEKLAEVAQSLSGDLHWVVADNGKLSDIQALGDMLQRESWQLDGAVLNAGVYQPTSSANPAKKRLITPLISTSKGLSLRYRRCCLY